MKYALVTGASSGIGKEFVKQLDQKGYHVIMLARRKEKLEDIALTLKNDPIICQIDITNLDQLGHLLDSFYDLKIEVVINNAGIGDHGLFEQRDFDKEDNMIDINVKAMHFLTKKMIQRMQRGYILNVSSIAGLLPGGPYMASYYGSKAYVSAFTLSLVEELKETKPKLYIGILCPGPVNSEFNQAAGIKSPLKGMEASECVQIALKEMYKKKSIIIPGFKNKIGVWAAKFMPRTLYIKFVSYQQKKKL